MSQIVFIAVMPTAGAINTDKLIEMLAKRAPRYGANIAFHQLNTPPITTSAIPAVRKHGISFLVMVPSPMNANSPTITPIIANTHALKPPTFVSKNYFLIQVYMPDKDQQ